MRDKNIEASGEECPCGAGAYGPSARCNHEIDRLNLYDICSTCGFKVWAHWDRDAKLELFQDWDRCEVGKYTETRIAGERITNIVAWVLAALLYVAVAGIIIWRVSQWKP